MRLVLISKTLSVIPAGNNKHNTEEKKQKADKTDFRQNDPQYGQSFAKGSESAQREAA